MSKGKIGVLTGGGDTTALNATLKGVALGAEDAGWEVIGIERGWAGLLATGRAVRLPAAAIDETRGGTIIRSSRTNLRKIPDGIAQASKRISELELDALVAIGGDDTLTVGVEVGDFHRSVPVNFVTKTIDNDVGTNPLQHAPYDCSAMKNYFCPGFPTAAEWLIRETASLRTTAYSHERILILEAMGRTAGWLALSTTYGHPDFIILPESPLRLDDLIEKVAERYRRERHVIIVIAEGAVGPDGIPVAESDEKDMFGHARLGGSSEWLAEQLKTSLGEERRALDPSGINYVIASYLQRCGSPVDIDRDTAIELGRVVAKACINGEDRVVGCPVLTEGVPVARALPVNEVLVRDETKTIIPRTVDPRLYDAANYAITDTALEYFRPIFGEIGDAYRNAALEPYRG